MCVCVRVCALVWSIAFKVACMSVGEEFLWYILILSGHRVLKGLISGSWRVPGMEGQFNTYPSAWQCSPAQLGLGGFGVQEDN